MRIMWVDQIQSQDPSPPVPALKSLSVRISRWKSTVVDGGRGMPKGSHHATDLTQEVSWGWGMELAAEWGWEGGAVMVGT